MPQLHLRLPTQRRGSYSMERLRAMALADRVSSIPATGGLSMVSLAGVPVLPMPEHVVMAAADAARHPRPRESRGTPGLRGTIATYLNRTQGLAVDPDRELLVTHGAQHGMSVALRSVLQDDSLAGKSRE